MRRKMATRWPSLICISQASGTCERMETTIVGFQCPTRMTQPNIDPCSAMQCPSERNFQEWKIMNSKPIKIPGPDQPITLSPTKARVTATVNGKRIADTREALTLKEAAYPSVQYIPRKDVDMTQLRRTGYETYCPYKGECAYYSIPVGGERSVNAVWSYEAPYAAVSAIREYLAFDPDRVDAIEIDSEESNKALVLEAFDTLFNKRDY